MLSLAIYGFHHSNHKDLMCSLINCVYIIIFFWFIFSNFLKGSVFYDRLGIDSLTIKIMQTQYPFIYKYIHVSTYTNVYNVYTYTCTYACAHIWEHGEVYSKVKRILKIQNIFEVTPRIKFHAVNKLIGLYALPSDALKHIIVLFYKYSYIMFLLCRLISLKIATRMVFLNLLSNDDVTFFFSSRSD